MRVIETPAQMIDYLKICEAAAVTEPTKSYYKRIREWLEELVRARADNARSEEVISKQDEHIRNLRLVLSRCGVGYKA